MRIHGNVVILMDIRVMMHNMFATCLTCNSMFTLENLSNVLSLLLRPCHGELADAAVILSNHPVFPTDLYRSDCTHGSVGTREAIRVNVST